jgi:hypothetical protein
MSPPWRPCPARSADAAGRALENAAYGNLCDARADTRSRQSHPAGFELRRHPWRTDVESWRGDVRLSNQATRVTQDEATGSRVRPRAHDHRQLAAAARMQRSASVG